MTTTPRKATSKERKANLVAVAEIRRLFPNIKGKRFGIHNLLITCSPYPFSSIPDCMKGLRSLSRRSGGDHERAMGIVERDMDRAMRKPNKGNAPDQRPGDQNA